MNKLTFCPLLLVVGRKHKAIWLSLLPLWNARVEGLSVTTSAFPFYGHEQRYDPRIYIFYT